MSIQSEIDRIKGEVNTQASLISQIRTAIQGKTGGSGGVETCTVTIINNRETTIDFVYVSENGYVYAYVDGSETISFSALKNSIIVLYSESSVFFGGNLAENNIEQVLAFVDEEGLYVSCAYIAGDCTRTYG